MFSGAIRKPENNLLSLKMKNKKSHPKFCCKSFKKSVREGKFEKADEDYELNGSCLNGIIFTIVHSVEL